MLTNTPTEVNANYPQYLWYPGVLANASSSSSFLAHKLHRHLEEIAIPTSKSAIKKLKKWINHELVIPGLGIHDATDDELEAVAAYPELAQPALARMISARAQIGWSTHGHSAVDVNIYSSGGRGTEAIRGNVENTEVGRFLHEYLDVDVDAVTEELRSSSSSWTTTSGSESEEEAAALSALAVEMGDVAGTDDHWARHEAAEMLRAQAGLGE